MTFETRVTLACRRNGYSIRWEPCKYGYRRAAVDCNTYGDFNAVCEFMNRLKKVRVESLCHFTGEFSGCVWVYDLDEYNDIVMLNEHETQSLNDWWMRYHNADKETRRLMACGAIE